MWLGGGSSGGAAAAAAKTAFVIVRYFSRERAPNLRKINPKVPPQEASSIAQGLYHVIKQQGPLSVSDTWNHAQEAGISGLNSKTHMKIMLKWMRGRNMLKLFCNRVGSSKKFLHCTLPEEPQPDQSKSSVELKLQIGKPSTKRKKQTL
ncbi:uncharacterized protein LOC130793299 [Actinidia eriantha]|uniref:uncharacterized protein LOC130793299 n=1 Tax=Actinidia eriantha TaxID=165200 RepID=UPI00258FFD92|nr:uncharacterized protein LOC130793299 [Actinidia eriantha]